MEAHVSIAAEKLFDLGPLAVTNSLLTTWVVMGFLLLIGLYLRARLNAKKPKGLQNILEIVVEGTLSIIESVTTDAKQARLFFGAITTIFLFVLLNNWAGLIPGVGAIGIVEEAEIYEETTAEVIGSESIEYSGESTLATAETSEVETAADAGEVAKSKLTYIFRSGSADLSFTLTLALIAIFLTQYHGIRKLGAWHYFSRFINFKGPIMFFVGILEAISELSKVISFSFRLFGNIFAGEVLLVVVTSLIPYVAPIPFYGLEIFVGAIQALVFAMLTLVFFKMATTETH